MKLFTQLQSFVSKKLVLGPAAATGLLANGDITGWQWVAITGIYLAVQGAVDAVSASRLDKGAIDHSFTKIAELANQLFPPAVIDEQNKITPKPEE